MDLYQNTEWKEVIINGENKKLPSDWELTFIKTLTKVTSGGTPSTKEKSYWDKKEIKWLSSGEVCNKKIYNTEKYISKNGLKNSSAKLIPSKSVLIALAGQGKTRGQVGMTEVELSTNQSVGAILPADTFNSDYLFFNLLNRYKELRNLSGGDNGRGGLNLEMIKNLNIMLPSYQQQVAIVSLLLRQNSIIEKTKYIISKIDERNQFMINELLSGRLRVKEEQNQLICYKNSDENWKSIKLNGADTIIPNEWEKEVISKNIKFSLGSTPIKTGDNYNGDIPWITISDLKQKNIQSFSAKIKKQKNTKIIPTGSLLGSFKMSVGKFGFTTKESATNEAIIAISPKDTTHNLNYLYYVLPQTFLQNAIQNAQGVLLLSTTVIKGLEFVACSIDEQNKIAELLNSLEKEKQKYEQILEKEEKTFTFLLEELMSGRLRIKI